MSNSRHRLGALLNTAHAQVLRSIFGLRPLSPARCRHLIQRVLTPEALLQSALRAGAGGLGAVRAAIPLAAAVPHHDDDDDGCGGSGDVN